MKEKRKKLTETKLWQKLFGNGSVLRSKDFDEIKKDAESYGVSSMKTAFILLWHKKLLIIAIAAAFALVLCGIFALQSRNTVNTTMSLNYEEASDGLNPNSTRFNMYEIKSTEVMQRAIDNMGLGDTITPEQLAGNISIETTNPREINTADSEYFISTSFVVKYTKNKEITTLSADEIVDMITKAYNDFFHENYGDRQNALVFEQPDIANMEYIEISDDMATQADRMLLYLSKRNKENGTFKSEENGETFQTLKQMVQNLSDYDIAKYRSHVLETGLAKDKTELLRTIEYSNSVLSMEYQKYMADYTVRQDAVNKYDEAMIGTVMIPSINDSNEYYMSRTNIGIDYLAKDAADQLTNATDTLKTIEVNNDIISKMQTRTPAAEDYTKADEMITSITSEFNRISELAMATDREYIKYKSKNYLTFMQKDLGIVERFSLDKVLILTVIFFIILCIVVYRLERRKLDKNRYERRAAQ